ISLSYVRVQFVLYRTRRVAYRLTSGFGVLHSDLPERAASRGQDLWLRVHRVASELTYCHRARKVRMTGHKAVARSASVKPLPIGCALRSRKWCGSGIFYFFRTLS